MSKQRSRLVRALANQNGQEFTLGISLGRDYVQRRSPHAFKSLRDRFQINDFRMVIENGKHPDRAGAIAKLLTGHSGFLGLIQDNHDIDYQNAVFLAGFVRGIAEEIESIDAESIALLQIDRQDELDLKQSFAHSMNKLDRHESIAGLVDPQGANRFGQN